MNLTKSEMEMQTKPWNSWQDLALGSKKDEVTRKKSSVPPCHL